MSFRPVLRVVLLGLLCAAIPAAAETTYLPGAAETIGLAGARFSSTLDLANPGATATTVTISLIPMAGKAAPEPVTRSLGAGESLRILGALASLFGLSGDAAGTLTVTHDVPILATLSTKNVASSAGTYGLGLLPVPSSQLLGAGETGHSIWASQSVDPGSGYRTNLSVTLVEPGVVEVRVLDAEGRVAGSATVTAARAEVWQQPLTALVGGRDLPVARAEFEVKSGLATAYAVVNDNVTSDAIALQAERVVPAPTEALVAGAALSSGHLGSFWVTDLRIFNPGTAGLEASIVSLGASREASATVSVPAKGLVEVPRVLALLGFPEGTACALRVRAEGPLLVAARTNNVDPAGVRKGTFSAQQFVTDWGEGLLGTGATGHFIGVDQTLNVPGARTNLTVVGGRDGAAGDLVLRDAAGAERGRRAFTRGAGEWGQLSVADWFAAPALRGGLEAVAVPENARIDVTVATGSIDAFVSRIDNGTGDAVTKPVARPEDGRCRDVAISSFTLRSVPARAGEVASFDWTIALDPPAAELTSLSIRFDGEAETDLDKRVRTYSRTFAASGSRTATLSARKGSCVKTRTLSFFVCGDALVIEPAALPDAVVYGEYGPVSLTAPSGASPLSFAVVDGTLPSGLALSPAGVLAGTPDFERTGTVTVRVRDANGCEGVRTYTLRVECPALSITPTSLGAGTVGVPYSDVRFQAQGSAGGGTWTGNGLPPGLSLSSGGVLSGTPTAAGSYGVTVRFRDPSGCSAQASFTLLVCSTIVVSPASLANATAGVAYGPVAFGAAGATGGATWTVTAGALPSGVALDPATGVLSGTPTVVGSFPFTVTATDSLGCRGSVAVTLVVGCPTISVAPVALPNGTAGVAYPATTLTQTGGVGAVTWSVTNGALPAGVTLSPAGVLSGTSMVVGSFVFTATATDSNGCTGSRIYVLPILCPTVSLGALSPATATAGVAYAATLTQTGGVGATTFAVTGGALPAGVTLSPSGLLSGSPLVTGTFGFTVTATDANACTGTQGYSLTVLCPTIAVSPASLAGGTAGVAYAPTAFTQTGGVGTVTWSLATGALPGGMTLDPATGILSGTPLQTGTFPITVRATDANGCTGDRPVTLVIACPTIAVNPASAPAGTAGVAFAGTTFTQTGGVGTIGWSLAAGVLPNGMTLDAGTGLLSGTPLQTGSFPITVRATDANACTGERALVLTIQCPTILVVPGGPLGGVEGTAITPVAFGQTGGVGGVAWTSAGALPTGLAFSAGGVLSGTPDSGTAGLYTVTFTATDANGCVGSTQITFRICPVVTVGPIPIAAFFQGLPYAETIASGGGAAPYAFTVSAGTLPAGIVFDGATGALSGIPTTLGTYDFTIKATDANGCAGSRQYAGRVCPVITVTANLPNGVVGTAYSQPLSASGSPDLPYAFSVTGGALPDGLDLVAGALTGTPTTAGTYTVTVTATDANGCTGSRTYTVEVCVAPSITPASGAVCALSSGNTASGPAGASTYAWTIANGTVISGASSQTVTYTAGASGNVTLTLTVSSASSCTASTSVDVPINALPATPAITGVPVSGVCADSTGNTATGPAGATTYAWSITGGTITSATNLQTVTYAAGPSGSVNLTLVVTNASGCSASNSTTATINANPATPAITTPTASVCTASPGNTATGPAGATTYAWSITGGGITSATNLRTVTYTAADTGNVQLTLVVTNASGCSATSSLVVPIDPLPTLLPATGTTFTGTFGASFSQAFTASGGTGPFTYSISPATPPAGLAFAGGTLSGTPNATGTFTFTVTATSAVGCASATQSYLLAVRPSLVADSYSGVGNTQVYVTGVAGAPTTPVVASATTAVANDLPAAGVTVTGVATPCVGLAGTMTIDAAGRFVYTPPVGLTGSDVCTYTATSDTGGTGTPASATGTITISLSNRVWYVNGLAVAGDGRSHSPFSSLASASAAHASLDVVFVQSGVAPTTTPGAITMQASTVLWGQGTALPQIGGITIQNTGATAKPVVTGTVTLGGSAITVSSLDVSTAGTTGLTDNQAAPLTGITVQNGVSVTATSAPAVVLSDVTTSPAGILLTSVTSSNSGGSGVSLTNVGGTFTAAGGAITNATGTAFLISGGTANVTYAGTIADDVGTLVSVASATGGTKLFAGAITDGDDGDGSGISLTGNTGATITFSGGLVLNTGPNPAFTATGGGTVNVCDESPCGASGSNGLLVNTIATSTATALNVANTTIGANDLEFRSISSSGGSATGIILSATGASGGLKVKGTGAAGSGGTIASKTGTDGDTATGIGIYLNQTANVSLAWMQLNDHQNFAIRGTAVTGFTLASSVVSGANGSNAAIDEAAVAFDGLTGTATISGSSLSGGVEDNFRVRNTTGVLNRITFDATTFGANHAATGNDGLNLQPSGTAVIAATIQNCSFTSAAGDLLQFNNLSSVGATSDLVVTGTAFSNNHPAIATGGGGVTIGGGDNGAGLTYTLTGNTFRDAKGTAVLLVKSTGAGTYSGTFGNNAIGVQAVANSGSAEGSGLQIQNAGNGILSATVTGNRIYQFTNYGINLQAGAGIALGGQLNLTVTGNTIATPSPNAAAISFPTNGIRLNSGVTPGDSFAVCAAIGGAGALANAAAGTGTLGAPDIRPWQRQATTVRLPGYGGANNDNSAVQAFVAGNNGGASVLAGNSVATGGGGFIGGAVCPTP
jgi:hypothetical protein